MSRLRPAERGLADWAGRSRVQPAVGTVTDARVDQVADGHADVDYMPPTNPDRPRPDDVEMVSVPLWLLVAARADAVSDRDRARDEFALLAPPGSPAGQVGDARVKQWAAMHPGYVALIDYPIGGSR